MPIIKNLHFSMFTRPLRVRFILVLKINILMGLLFLEGCEGYDVPYKYTPQPETMDNFLENR